MIVYCLFTVGSAKFLKLSFVIFVEVELTELGFVREECEKKLWEPQPLDSSGLQDVQVV